MRVVRKNNPNYDLAREISNARFDLRPDAIFFCDNQRDLADLLRHLSVSPPQNGIRVRAGGHQHEGQSSGDGVAIIDISEISRINVARRSETAWIGAGAEFQTIYGAMDAKKLFFPGGGCGDVHLGGFVHGAGWGLYARHLGLGCDQLQAVRMVTADGRIRDDVSDQTDRDLMWALRGGGGGNFGIVTDFCYTLTRWPENLEKLCNFTLRWTERSQISKVLREWATYFPVSADTRLTTYCRLTLVEKELDAPGDNDDVPITIGGTFLGTEEEAHALLKTLLPETYGDRYDSGQAENALYGDVFYPEFSHIHPDYQPGPYPEEVDRVARAFGGYENMLGAAPKKVQSTCSGQPYPHKVSGFVPKTRIETSSSGVLEHTPDPQMIDVLQEMFNKPAGEKSKVRRYLSLHSLGGEVFTNEGYRARSAFPYRDRPFLFQPQAWWADPKAAKEGLDFVADLRKRLAPYAEGGFINFPDFGLAGPKPASRDEVLLPYYGPENLKRLRQIKARVDPNNVFDFPMGILPAE